MKTLQLFLLFFMCVSYTYGQQVEFAGQVNSGLSRFSGESARESTYMGSYIADASLNYTYSPYGKQLTASYGISAQVQRITRSRLLFGMQAGAEALRSLTKIQGVVVSKDVTSSYQEVKEATGKTIMRNDFINLHPYLGYRATIGTVDLDFIFGPDIGIGVGSREKGEATAEDGTEHATERKRGAPETDIRARLGATAYRHNFGITASYGHGLTNYMRLYDGGNPALYARVWRIGLLYRL